MPTINVSLPFSSDDGEAEKFTSTDTSEFADGVYDGSEGNPSGSVKFDIVDNLTNDFVSKYYPNPFATQATFEDWGVPPGSTITTINNFAADGAYLETHTNGSHGLWIWLRVNNVTVRNRGLPSLDTGDTSWQALFLHTTTEAQFPCSSDTTFSVIARMLATTFATGTRAIYFDNIAFDIEYTAGADVQCDGELLSQPATMEGFAQVWPATTEQAKTQTLDYYTLTADGVEIPLLSFTVKRTASAETARIDCPVEFAAAIESATLIDIDITSTDNYGTTTNKTLFSGALDYHSTSKTRTSAVCIGDASWPARVIRYVENVSYINDDGSRFSFRAPVDPDFYPDFIGYYGLRRIDINSITYSVNETQSFMELADIGQV